ncbi:MAG TPA: glutamine--fructose-6-phosphate transaminase (isomerizing) [Caldisericia bacterium]|nr:glutamine--fructose-6-phosphate transaminase (isomerizing) [Caldisericia bacterium]HPC56829.1 glutamine--fructose-6-phosphate transaminase (isomerizing) [Caldisericia bacterium]HRU73787.1 glutamine--fructose-6-phosphate transaminase (isomerizing) [Caldisericia bacterium]
MCGIVGYIGDRKILPIIIDGLKRLEYRGYDSAGVALVGNDSYFIKTKGRISLLEEKINNSYIDGNYFVGIGQTRWATHGEPSDLNAHPHIDCNGEIFVVHNGIIENYYEIKKDLIERGHRFLSETDTEVVPHLIEEYYEGDILKAVLKAVNKLRGSFALAILSKKERDKIIAVRKESPLIVGIGKNENFLASDIPALLPHTKNIVILKDGEIALITKDEIKIFDMQGNQIGIEKMEINWNLEQSEKKGYKHFMLKEIMEEGEVLKEVIRGRVKDEKIELNEIKDKDFLKKVENIYIIACGTAYHAGLIGNYILTDLLDIPVKTEVASEFRYENPNLSKNSLVILVSQSGETADTIASLRVAKKLGAKTLGVVNVNGSTIFRESDEVLQIFAGPEIAVASTKAYVAQILTLLLFSVYIGKIRGDVDEDFEKFIVGEIKRVSEFSEILLDKKDEYLEIAKEIKDLDDIFYIGRLLDYPTALEGALKLKEISYIHAEGYPAGELKHGPLALIEEKVPTFAISTDERVFEKIVSNIKEVKARNGKVYSIVRDDFKGIIKESDRSVIIPKTHIYLSPILSVIPLQLIAYFTADLKGLDVDKPRNLAKSVTVE